MFADAAADFAVETFTPSDEKAADAPTVIDAPPLAPHGHEADATKFEPGEPENIETIAARRARHKYADRKQKRSALRQIASLPVADHRAAAHRPRRAAMARRAGAPVSADRVAVRHDRHAGQSARA